MRVLALDTSLGATSVAVVDFPTGTIIGQSSLAMERGHAEALVPMVRDVLAVARVGWDSINRVVTTVGPGSFTGLRVAVAAARAFALAHKLPVVGVSTLTAYAAPLLAAGSARAVAVAIDARHGSIFYERFLPVGSVACPPRLLTIEAALQDLSSAPARVVGNASVLLGNAASELGLACIAEPPQHAPDIEWVARLGAAAKPETAPARPLYLRAVSATPQANAAILRA